MQSVSPNRHRRNHPIAFLFAHLLSSVISKHIIIIDALSPGSQLSLCECMEAQGSPNGLSCDKDGWFIIGFSHSGTWGGDSGGLVPLSRAMCCRPCVPSSIDPTPDVSTIRYQAASHRHRKFLDVNSEAEVEKQSSPPPAPSSPDDDDDLPTNKSKAVAIVRQATPLLSLVFFDLILFSFRTQCGVPLVLWHRPALM